MLFIIAKIIAPKIVPRKLAMKTKERKERKEINHNRKEKGNCKKNKRVAFL